MEEGLDKVQMGHGMALSRKTDGFLWIIVGKIHIYIYIIYSISINLVDF